MVQLNRGGTDELRRSSRRGGWMIEATAGGYGRKYERPYDISIMDAFGDIAAVRVLSSVYVDYLHVARVADGWQLLNVLWQRRPGR